MDKNVASLTGYGTLSLGGRRRGSRILLEDQMSMVSRVHQTVLDVSSVVDGKGKGSEHTSDANLSIQGGVGQAIRNIQERSCSACQRIVQVLMDCISLGSVEGTKQQCRL
jgi:hypothetical protein